MEKEIKQAYKDIENLTQKAKNAVNEARQIAEKYGLVFTIDLGFGICGIVDESKKENKKDEDWELSSVYDEDWISSTKCW